MGLPSDSYEAYCLDEAVCFFGMVLEHELEQVSHRPGKEERRAMAAQEALLKKVFDPRGEKERGSGFADPAVMFQ